MSTLTAETDVASTTTAACSSTTDDAITVPLPKQKKQRTTASALEKKRVDDLKMKKHKVAAHKEAVRLYCGENPETGCVVELAFQAGFAHTQNLRAWAKVGAVPLTRACLQNLKV